MHKQVLFSLHPSALIFLFLLLAACTSSLDLSDPTPTADENLARQGMINRYRDFLEKRAAMAARYKVFANCSVDEGIALQQVSPPALQTVFPDATFFVGAIAWSCVDLSPLTSHAYQFEGFRETLIVVHKGEVYFFDFGHGNDKWYEYVDFNRLLVKTGYKITEETKPALAKALVEMAMFAEYSVFFDADMFYEGLKPATYRIKEKVETVIEAKEWPFEDQLSQRLIIGVWNSNQSAILGWRVIFDHYNGFPSHVNGGCLNMDIPEEVLETYPLITEYQGPYVEDRENYRLVPVCNQNTGFDILLPEEF